jgi:hypothetical protein
MQEPKGSPGIFLGLEGDSLYIIYDFNLHKIVVRADVDFFDHKFPGLRYHKNHYIPLGDLLNSNRDIPKTSRIDKANAKFKSSWDKSEENWMRSNIQKEHRGLAYTMVTTDKNVKLLAFKMIQLLFLPLFL